MGGLPWWWTIIYVESVWFYSDGNTNGSSSSSQHVIIAGTYTFLGSIASEQNFGLCLQCLFHM